MHILLGNANPIQAALGLADATDRPPLRWQPDADLPAATSITLFDVPDSDGLIDEALPTIVRSWAQSHSDLPPVWIASDSEAAAMLLSSHFHCPIEDLDGAMTRYRGLVDELESGAAG